MHLTCAIAFLSNQIVVQIDQKNRGPYGPQLAIFMSDSFKLTVHDIWSYRTCDFLSSFFHNQIASDCSITLHGGLLATLRKERSEWVPLRESRFGARIVAQLNKPNVEPSFMQPPPTRSSGEPL
jgi:hypothetical protein